MVLRSRGAGHHDDEGPAVRTLAELRFLVVAPPSGTESPDDRATGTIQGGGVPDPR